MITVADVIALALPPGTTVVAGSAGLGREVTWASRIRPTPPAFGHLGGGELVLLAATVLDQLDERLTIEAAIHQLAAFGVAAVALAGEATGRRSPPPRKPGCRCWSSRRIRRSARSSAGRRVSSPSDGGKSSGATRRCSAG
jgi:hypothetical protein